MIALLAAITLQEHPGTTIVTDSVTSDGLTTFIEGLGGKHLRWAAAGGRLLALPAVAAAAAVRLERACLPLTACLLTARSFKRGYKNVIDKGIELGRAGQDCQLMMETSGHGALAENDYLDDGSYLAVKVGQGCVGGCVRVCMGWWAARCARVRALPACARGAGCRDRAWGGSPEPLPQRCSRPRARRRQGPGLLRPCPFACPLRW
jgi:hypothetical protein